jgi:zinc/manganese transport system substrate-binding protein
MIMILSAMITILIANVRSRMTGTRLLAPLLALTMLMAACGAGGGAAGDRLLVVATTSIWGDVVSQLVGDAADVEVLIPRGADSHDYEPTSREVALLQEADLVVANGLGLEEGLMDVLESAAADGANILEMAPLVNPIPFAVDDHEDEDHDREDEAHEHGDLDPHVWFDLARVEIAVGHIAEQLGDVDGSVDWAARAEEYSAELREADEEAMTILDVVSDESRRMVTNHEALGYFADRFDFEVVGVVIPGGSSLADPSSAELAALVEEMQHEGVTTIFAETTSPTRLAEAVAAEVGEDVVVVELYTESLGDPGSEAETLIDLVVSNARLVADALAG